MSNTCFASLLCHITPIIFFLLFLVLAIVVLLALDRYWWTLKQRGNTNRAALLTARAFVVFRLQNSGSLYRHTKWTNLTSFEDSLSVIKIDASYKKALKGCIQHTSVVQLNTTIQEKQSRRNLGDHILDDVLLHFIDWSCYKGTTTSGQAGVFASYPLFGFTEHTALSALVGVTWMRTEYGDDTSATITALRRMIITRTRVDNDPGKKTECG